MNALPARIAATVDRTNVAAPAAAVSVFTIAGYPIVAGREPALKIEKRPLLIATHAALALPSTAVSTLARCTRPGIPTAIFCVHGLRVGEVVACLPRQFVMHFLTGSVSMALHVAGRQRLALMPQVGGFALRSWAVVIGALWTGGGLTEVYALSALVFYIAYLVTVLRTADCDGAALARALRTAASGCVAWVAVGAVASIALHALSGV